MECTDDGIVFAVASRSFEKAKITADQYNIPQAYDDYHEILRDDSIDAVYIPLINSLHYPYAKEALLAGKHTIVEKPFVLHQNESEELNHYHKCIQDSLVFSPVTPVGNSIRYIGFCEQLYKTWNK